MQHALNTLRSLIERTSLLLDIVAFPANLTTVGSFNGVERYTLLGKHCKEKVLGELKKLHRFR